MNSLASPSATSARSTKEVNAALRKLNGHLQGIGAGYHDSALPAVIPNAVAEYGFDASDLVTVPFGDSGRQSTSIGEGKFLHLSWYRMEVSGRYEIVAYAN